MSTHWVRPVIAVLTTASDPDVRPLPTSQWSKSASMPVPVAGRPSHEIDTIPVSEESLGADGTDGGVTSDATVTLFSPDHSPGLSE